MAAKGKKATQNGNPKGFSDFSSGLLPKQEEENAFLRILHLPMVTSACQSLQKTYATAKEAHPMMASLCEAYGRGIQCASALAVWSVKPVVQKLEPQVTAANVLACRGLDHLEQKIPALHEPVGKVTSDLKDSLSTHFQTAVCSVAETLDRVLGLAAKSYDRSESTVRDAAEYTRHSRVSQWAEAGMDAAIGLLETLLDFLLPKAKRQSAHDPPGACVSNETTPTSTIGRIRALAGTISQRAYRQTAQAVQHTRDKGKELATWISGPSGVAGQSTTEAHQVLPGAENSSTRGLRRGSRKAPEKVEEPKQEDDKRNKTTKGTETQSLVGSLTETLQAASFSTIARLKNAPFAAWNTAGQLLQVSPHKTISEASAKEATLPGTLQSATSSLLGMISHYVPLPRLLVKEKEPSDTMDHAESQQQLEDGQSQEEEASNLLRGGDRRSSRGHHPFFFLQLDEPLLPQQALSRRRSPAFEAEYAGSRKSAFSPYKEVVSSRRRSEGFYRPGPEPIYTRALYPSLHGATFKKD
ncbi:perilipin-1 [Hemicordylus capensis]|uniref:perilipin-1 n=1 Tax=Hemicordylus capensis TaxID=884348 RepID=UPI0023039726|nr:perilipin-1 [Hemicordylus capensis]